MNLANRLARLERGTPRDDDDNLARLIATSVEGDPRARAKLRRAVNRGIGTRGLRSFARALLEAGQFDETSMSAAADHLSVAELEQLTKEMEHE